MDRPSSLVPVSRPRVLLLEDSDPDAERLISWLREARPAFQVEHVSTLDQALSLLEEAQWDVVLLDLCVSDSRGLATFEAARAAARDVPIVVHSGITLESLALEAVARGAQDYLVKREVSPELVRRSLRYAIERARVERELRESRERFRLALDGAHDGIWDWNLDDGQLFVSDRWCEMLGYGLKDIGTDVEDWWSLLHPRDRDGFLAAINAHLDGAERLFEVEHRILHCDGSWRWVRTRGLAVRDAAGRPRRMAGSQSDVTQRRHAEAQLLHQAMHDGLTGLPNRSLFLDRVSHAALRSERRDARGFAVLFLDLDRFKVINDSLGHGAGDELLLAVGRRLRDCVRPGDTVARLGGDEFGVLVEEAGGSGAPETIATRIHRALAQPFQLCGQEVFTSTSVGIARHNGGDMTPEALLRNADIAMYRAKKAGRACSEVFDEALAAWEMGRMTIENGLRRAVERDELVVHYQPIVHLASGRMEGFEALARWESPERGLIGPGEFIPVAEETGQIIPVGRWILRRACRQVAELNQLLPADQAVRVGVNVSSRQLVHREFIQTVEDALSDSGLPATRLVLELTETALMENPDRAAETLMELRGHGIRVHLDDFGNGYSALGYLRRFPIDRLKIDRCFVSGIGLRPDDEAIVRAILGLAEALGLEVVAEGIETGDQLEALAHLRCGFGQGFHFSPPVDMPAALGLARRPMFGLSTGAWLTVPA